MNGSTHHRDRDDRDDDGGGTLRTLILVAIFIAGLALVSRVVRPPKHDLEGKPAPEFALTTLDTGGTVPAGKRIALQDLRGKAVLLDFWAAWCPPCKAQTPILDSLSKRLGDRGLVVVGVGTQDEDTDVAAFAKQHGLSYPIVMDERNNAIARAYGVQNLPTLVLLAKDGTIRAVRVGRTDASELERLVLKEL